MDNCDIIAWEENYCYNERNQLTERKALSGITEYLYDENGSLVREKEGSKTASYQYDLLNRQTYVKTLDGKEQENSYDGEGLRAGIKEDGKVSTFLFLNGEILAESDGDRKPVRRHLSGMGLSHVEDISTGIFHTYHQDEQGSTAYITGSDGVAENCYIYDAFGNVLEKKEEIRSRILYTGQQYDQETGQYYLRARYYNPVIGRFTQEDTYRGDGLNLYAYCANNSVVYYDPSGHDGIGVCPSPNQADNDKPKTVIEVGMDEAEALDETYYFRGTTEGYEGNKSLQKAGITPASTDPLVATVFATESAQHGNGVVYIASDSDLKGVTISEGNVLSNLENEVGVEILPKEFAARSSLSVSAQDSRTILSEMGYDIPSTIYNKEQLNRVLVETPRLSDNDIQIYINKILGR